MPNNIIDKIQLSGVTYAIGGGGGTVSSAITSGDTNAVAGGAVYDKFDEVEQVTAAALNDINDRVSEDEEVTAAALNVLNESLSGKQDTLSAGTGIDITSNVISVTGSTGGKAIEAGRGISVTTGETADTVSFNLPISADSKSNIFIHETSNVINGNSYVTKCFVGGNNNTLNLNGTSYGNFYNFVYGNYNTITKNNKTNAYNNTIFGENNTLSCSGQTCDSFVCGKRNSGTTSNQYIFGSNNIANNVNEFVFGRVNKSERVTNLLTFGDSGNTLFSIGNGTWGNYTYQQVRHNAFEVRQNGDIYIADVNDTSTSNYYEKPMIKLQDALGGGSSYTAGDGIDITNDVISVTGKVDTTTYSTYTAATYNRLDEDEEVTAAALNNLNDRLSEDEEVTAAALNNLNEALSGKQDTLIAGENITISGNVISATGGGGGGTVESAITSGSTNAVESKAIWSATTYNKDVLITFNGTYSTNYPNGFTKIKVEGITSNSNNHIIFYGDNKYVIGTIIVSNRGSISVDTSDFQAATYEISGSTVIISYPTVTSVNKIRVIGDGNYVYKAVVEGVWIADNTYMKQEVDAIASGLQNNINSKLDATAYTPTVVDSALSVASTNPVQNQALYSELRIDNGGGGTETTLVIENNFSTNYPSGCTQIKVEVVGSNNNSNIGFFNGWSDLGSVTINNWGNISVTNSFDGATYEISGTTVIISYPTVTNVTKIRVNGDGNYVYKAVTTEPPTVLKDQVVANTTALGGLSLVKLTQTEYDNLQTKDNSTLYVIVG